jgi:hypothetical protein
MRRILFVVTAVLLVLVLSFAVAEVVPLTVELRRRSVLDQAASSLAGVTAAMVWSSATRSAGRCR